MGIGVASSMLIMFFLKGGAPENGDRKGMSASDFRCCCVSLFAPGKKILSSSSELISEIWLRSGEGALERLVSGEISPFSEEFFFIFFVLLLFTLDITTKKHIILYQIARKPFNINLRRNLMIRSMTGFGAAQSEGTMGVFSVEIKSVNNRFLEFGFRMSSSLSRMEMDLRELLGGTLKRGRVEVSIRWTPRGEMLPSLEINCPLMKKIVREIKECADNLGLEPVVHAADIFNVPNIFIETPPTLDDKELWENLKNATSRALADIQRSREREGARLAQELDILILELNESRKQIMARKDIVLTAYHNRLMKKIEEFNKTSGAPIDMARLDAEVLIYADKSDISEELARLDSHIVAFRDQIATDTSEPAGRPLEFLCQEMLREVNTIGSKSHDTALANHVLSMKNTLEKVREQIQNIE